MNDIILIILFFCMGMTIGWASNVIWVHHKIEQIQESSRQAYEMEKRIWADVLERLAKEKGEGK